MLNMWEIPGGKMKTDEDIFSALERELEEEVGCKIETTEIHNDTTHEYETFIINLITIKSENIGEPPIPK
jgi:8-oxo-dGTP diphosphatase